MFQILDGFFNPPKKQNRERESERERDRERGRESIENTKWCHKNFTEKITQKYYKKRSPIILL